MPGLSFIYNINGLEQKESDILQSLNSLIHNNNYYQKILLEEKLYFLGWTGYNKYPMMYYENDDFYIYVEGKIYAKERLEIKNEINILAKNILQNPDNLKKQTKEWLLDRDGEFIIIVIKKDFDEIFIINDGLGRLPLYYYSADGEFILSRELRFITNFINDVSFDRVATAYYLLFGYPLGKRTLFNDISYLEPATLIRIKISTAEIKKDNIFQFNFEEKKYKELNYNENLLNLLKLFCEACENRTNSNNKNVVSLSGGLDSRAVASGLNKRNIPFFGVTFLDYHGMAECDVKIAKKVANTLNFDLKIFNLDPPKGKYFKELLRIKNGLNCLRMSFILSFFHLIKKNFGDDIIYFTGDGGDKLFPDLRPYIKIKDLDELISFIIANNQLFSLNTVATLVKINKSEIISEIKKHLLTYPEKNLHSKYVHFLIYERGFKYLFEGEDRNRYYFWSTSPFYSIKFFNYIMNCPDDIKKQYRLYRDFLLNLSQQAAFIENANWLSAITSLKFILYMFIDRFGKQISLNFPLKLPRFITKKFWGESKSYEQNSNIMNCLNQQIENNKCISKYLSISDVNKTIENISKYNFEFLFSLTSAIEEFECSKSSIDKYEEINLI